MPVNQNVCPDEVIILVEPSLNPILLVVPLVPPHTPSTPVAQLGDPPTGTLGFSVI